MDLKSSRDNKTRILLFIFSVMLVACKAGKETPPAFIENGTYKLTWNDEFDYLGKPDDTKWIYESGFVRNRELQWYQENNASVSNGYLTIEGKRERKQNPQYDTKSDDWRLNREFAEYTASSILTRGKFSFQYGLMLVSAKIDTAKGLWPAIWMLGESKEWPSNGEIDVMEFYRYNDHPVIMANAAWGDHWSNPVWDSERISFDHFLAKDPEWPQKFHVWKMYWTKDYIKLYLDDELLNQIDLDSTVNSSGFNPFHQPHYILLNLAIGSNGGNPSNTPFPKKYEIDYVRVYQQVAKES